MEILVAIHPDEYPTSSYLRSAEVLNRLADGEWVTLRLSGEGPDEVDGGFEAAILRDVADALRDVAGQSEGPLDEHGERIQ